MNKSLKSVMPHVILLLTMFLVGLWVFKDFFKFSLWGDDWMLSFYILEHRIAGTIPRLYFSLYGGQAMLMDFMNHIFRYDPKYYFYTSFILKFIASVSIYIFTFYLAKRKLTAFFAGLLFLVSFTGIESTNWVHNSVNYLALAMFLFAMIYWLRHEKESSEKLLSKNILTSLVLFTISIILAGVRMHGLILFFTYIEIYSVFMHKSKLKNSLVRIMIVTGIFWIFSKLGFFGQVGDFTSGMIRINLLSYIAKESTNIYRLMLFPFGSFANMILPMNFLSSNSFYQEFLVNTGFGLYEMFFFSIPILMINFLIIKKYKIGFWICIAVQIVWVLLFIMFIQSFGEGLGSVGSQILLGIILFFTFVMFFTLLIVRKKYEEARYLVFFLFMPFAFILVTHTLLVNESTIESYSRYLTLSSGGVSILIPYVLFSAFGNPYQNIETGLPKRLNKYFSLLIMAILLYVHLRGSQLFFSSFPYRRDNLVKKTWEIINYYGSKIPYDGRIRIFIFDFDNKDRDYYQTVVGFGGTYRFALQNGIKDRQQLVVFLSKDDLGVVLKAFQDPTVAVIHWGPVIKDHLKLDDVYGFILKDGTVISADDVVREKIINLAKKGNIKIPS